MAWSWCGLLVMLFVFFDFELISGFIWKPSTFPVCCFFSSDYQKWCCIYPIVFVASFDFWSNQDASCQWSSSRQHHCYTIILRAQHGKALRRLAYILSSCGIVRCNPSWNGWASTYSFALAIFDSPSNVSNVGRVCYRKIILIRDGEAILNDLLPFSALVIIVKNILNCIYCKNSKQIRNMFFINKSPLLAHRPTKPYFNI